MSMRFVLQILKNFSLFLEITSSLNIHSAALYYHVMIPIRKNTQAGKSCWGSRRELQRPTKDPYWKSCFQSRFGRRLSMIELVNYSTFNLASHYSINVIFTLFMQGRNWCLVFGKYRDVSMSGWWYIANLRRLPPMGWYRWRRHTKGLNLRKRRWNRNYHIFVLFHVVSYPNHVI